MAKGYMGRILWVDLSEGEIREEIIPDKVYEQHLSGTGQGERSRYGWIVLGLPGRPGR
jgi:aldehyde:ferredoxin oxidoreductase